MSSRTVRLHRVLRTRPAKVYRAFLHADALAKWLPPHGFTGRLHRMDATVGRGYTKMSFTNFGTGQTHSSAQLTSSSRPTSASATRTSSTTLTCPATCMSRSSSGRS